MFDLDIDVGTAALRLALAMILGAVIGWDRESRHRPAGLRTHMLVCLGAATLAVIASGLFTYESGTSPAPVRVDPVRILAAVVGGIGFLGAGAIMRRGERVSGLTTAAGLWVSAAIGLACGLGIYALALLAAAFTFVTIVTLRSFDRAIAAGRQQGDRQDGDAEPGDA